VFGLGDAAVATGHADGEDWADLAAVIATIAS
jgi:hypothetical protein